MSTLELRRNAKAAIEKLPDEKVTVAAEFLAFLSDRITDEATAELLKIPGLRNDLKRARREAAAGKGVNWREVRSTI